MTLLESFSPPRVATGVPWLLRVNPLGVVTLGDADLRVAVDRLAAAERETLAAAGTAADALYELIGRTTDVAERRALVALRRAAHNDRAPGGDVSGAPPEVHAWLAARTGRDRARAAVEGRCDEAADRERGTLAALLGDDDLRRSLALVAPEVGREAERYRRAAGAGPVPSRIRKSERGLLQYVLRAMVRTSPLARFTAVGLAVPDATGTAPGPLVAAADAGGAVSVPGLDRPTLTYVLGGLSAPDPDPWVGLAPSTSHEPGPDGRLLFLRRTDEGAARCAVPLRGPVAALLDALSMGPRRSGDVAATVAGLVNCPVPDAARLVAGALDGGILCTWPGPDDGGPDPLDDLPEGLRAGLDRVGDGPAGDRPAAIAALDEQLTGLAGAARRPARVLVEEDYVLAPRTVSTAGLRDRLDDLGTAVDLMSTFDWLHDVRILLTAAFVDRFGPGGSAPLVATARELSDEVFRRMTLAAGSDRLDELGTADGALPALHALRHEIHDTLDARIAAAAPGDTVRVGPDEVAAWVARLPDRLRREPLGYGAFVQPCGDRLVLNDGLPGNGMLCSRFLDADRRLGGNALAALRDRIERRYRGTPGALVETLGLHRLNVNAHPQVLAERLRTEDWFGLRFRHDPATDTLSVVDAGGRPLRVLFVGAGHPGLLPPPLLLATCLSSSGRLNNGFLDDRHARLGSDGSATVELPRVELGSVVLARRRWYGGAELEGALAGDAGALAGVTRWRARHDVPSDVMLKTAFRDLPEERRHGVEPARGSRHKPQYLDLSSALCTRVLPRLLERRSDAADAVQFVEEALPAPVAGTHTTEWVVEVGSRPGGRFRAEDGSDHPDHSDHRDGRPDHEEQM